MRYMPEAQNASQQAKHDRPFPGTSGILFCSIQNYRVDYFWPFYVFVRRSTEKRWGFLFTCSITRAVHFEEVSSMHTNSYVMGTEKFVSRSDVPSIFWSDNGINFIPSEKELLQNIFNWNERVLVDSVVKNSNLWKFNPPSLIHYGGSWGLFLRCFKYVFYAIIGKRRLTDKILNTIFC